MKHLLLQHRLKLVSSLLRRILPWRFSFLHFPKTIPSPSPSPSPSPPSSNLTLKLRIEQAHDSSVSSITPLLRQWGNQSSLSQLRSIISSLHRSHRFSHALQISEWICDQKQSYNLSSVDFETRLLLIAKVHGLQEAHAFLDTIPIQKRDFYVHYALLNFCKTHSSVALAESTFEKMKELGLACSKAYNTMLCIYHEAANHGMVVKLLGEMDDMVPEGVSFNKLLTSYTLSSLYDIQGMERFLGKWKHMMDPWVTLYFPGLLYIGAGSVHKGLALLRKTEKLELNESCRKTAYEGLMKVYCHLGERDDVYRLWNLAKDHNISFDSSKCSDIIKAFTRTRHLDEVLEEWDDENVDLGLKDFGLEKRYAKEEAEKVVNTLEKKKEGSKWESLATKLTKLVEDEDDREEERMEKVEAAMKGRLRERWNPKGSMALCAYACVQYVEGRRDAESAANILRLLDKQEQLLRATDKERLSMKIVEAMRGGGYVGGRGC
ncbi:unnamed protein product [Cochlearia groenlandica]